MKQTNKQPKVKFRVTLAIKSLQLCPDNDSLFHRKQEITFKIDRRQITMTTENKLAFIYGQSQISVHSFISNIKKKVKN